MSKLLKLFPEVAEKHYYQNSETKEFWFHATGICNALGFDNVGRALQMYTDEDERFQEIYQGRAVWFVSEAGCYGLAMASKKENALKFKRWLKHDVLPKLRASGYYVMPTATSEQLEAAQKEIRNYQIERGYLLEWSPRMSIQKMRFLELINFKAEEYSPFFLDAHDRHRFVDSCYWQKLQKYQKGATIMFALIDTLLEPDKKVSVSTFGCKTVSGLMAKVPYKFYRVLTIPCQGIYQKLNPLYKHLEQSVELKEKYGEVWLKYVPEKRKELKKFLNESLVA